MNTTPNLSAFFAARDARRNARHEALRAEIAGRSLIQKLVHLFV